jgi:hypothetical protein
MGRNCSEQHFSTLSPILVVDAFVNLFFDFNPTVHKKITHH